jgi:hypothetical protein
VLTLESRLLVELAENWEKRENEVVGVRPEEISQRGVSKTSLRLTRSGNIQDHPDQLSAFVLF